MSEAGDAIVAELKRWRDVRSVSQTKLARQMRYDRSYISKMEDGGGRPGPVVTGVGGTRS